MVREEKDMSANSMNLPRFVAGITIGAAVVLGLAVGTAVSASAGGLPFAPPNATPDYPRNAAGESYGTAAQARAPEEEPDLILAVATNGNTGYVRATELYGDLGSLRTPEQNISYTDALRLQEPRAVDVYEADGRTVIGVFQVGPISDEARGR